MKDIIFATIFIVDIKNMNLLIATENIYNLIKKDNLITQTIVKDIIYDILLILKEGRLKIANWKESKVFCAQVKVIIRNKLWFLPIEDYNEKELDIAVETFFDYIKNNY